MMGADATEGTSGAVRERRGKRLVGLGARVAAVAHEIKVPLSLIVGSLESLEAYVGLLVDRVRELEARGTPDGSTVGGHVLDNTSVLVRICREGADRLESVVDEITSYARGGTPPPAEARADVARLLRSAVDLVARATPHAPPVLLELPDLPPVCADVAALTRAFVNLLRNAFDALAGSPQGLVCVTAAVRVGCVEVRISDNGPGIAPDDRDRIFEPFFTGKAFGDGLGLGLAIARELVEAQQGSLELAEPASGTQFVIRIPVAP